MNRPVVRSGVFRLVLMDGFLGLLLACCCLGALWVPGFLAVSLRFPPQAARVASDTLVVRLRAEARERQVVLSEGGPVSRTPPHRVTLDDRVVWEGEQWAEWLVLQGLAPGPHTLRLEARWKNRQAVHQVTFTVVEEPSPWRLDSLPDLEPRLLFWFPDNRPVVSRGQVFGTLRVEAARVPGLEEQALEPFRRALWVRVHQEGMDLVLPSGARVPLGMGSPEWEEMWPEPPGKARDWGPGWYRVEDWDVQGRVWRFRLVAHQVEAPNPPWVVPPFDPATAFADARGVFLGHSPAALEPAYVLWWPPHDAVEPRLLVAPTALGRQVGPGVWFTEEALWVWEEDRGWRSLPLPQGPWPPTPQEWTTVDPRTPLRDTVLLQARWCRGELWLTAAWWSRDNIRVEPYLARWARGRWQALPTPAPFGGFLLYCLQETPWALMVLSPGDPLTEEQAVWWGRGRPGVLDSWRAHQGVGLAFRWTKDGWEPALSPPYAGDPWGWLPHPAGPAFEVRNPANAPGTQWWVWAQDDGGG